MIRHVSTNVDDNEEEEAVRKITADKPLQHSFRILETDKVAAHMSYILQSMQQTAVKRLAKAWIKGICPKKQAKFPYHKKEMVPDWWPSTSSCPFTEPDHVRKDRESWLVFTLLKLTTAQRD